MPVMSLGATFEDAQLPGMRSNSAILSELRSSTSHTFSYPRNLGELLARRAVCEIAQLLYCHNDGSRIGVATYAASTLRMLLDGGDREDLLRAVRQDPNTVQALTDAVTKQDLQHLSEASITALDLLVELCDMGGPPSKSELVQILTMSVLSKSPKVVGVCAAAILGEREGKDAIPTLVLALQSPANSFRQGVFDVLEELEPGIAYEPLRQTLLHKSTESDSREIFLGYGEKGCNLALDIAQNAKDYSTQWRAIVKLGQFDDPRAYHRLIEILQGPSDDLREVAIHGLASWKGLEKIEPVSRLLVQELRQTTDPDGSHLVNPILLFFKDLPKLVRSQKIPPGLLSDEIVQDLSAILSDRTSLSGQAMLLRVYIAELFGALRERRALPAINDGLRWRFRDRTDKLLKKVLQWAKSQIMDREGILFPIPCPDTSLKLSSLPTPATKPE